MRKFLFLFAQVLLITSFSALAQSTSPNPQPNNKLETTPRALAANSSQVITFSEYSVGTTITNQYKNIGVIFTGGTFISSDGSNPTSPVLSGSPRFQGPITGRFVIPNTEDQAVVKSFTLDAGYFDNLTSTRIEWFDSDGNKLGQKINSKLGIEQITVEGGDIAYFTMNVVADEPAGYAIDNLSFVPVGPSILFRENNENGKEGSWGLINDDIPGFDHIGFLYAGKVYESHPPYDPGIYLSKDGKEQVSISAIDGKQYQFTRATFEHDSKTSVSKLRDFDEIPVDEELAKKMSSAIERVNPPSYGYIDFSFPFGLQATLLPPIQKGNKGTFTCVGLVEWAAEQAGHNGGQGFIPNFFESFNISISGIPLFEVPTLSPELLNYAMKGQSLLLATKQWIQGYLDPVDFIVTDPLGRRLGYIQGVGSFREIPLAFYPGDGKTEQFLIPQAIPGMYKITLSGKGEFAFAGFGSKESSVSFSGMLNQGQKEDKALFVKPTVGCMGDVNLDGTVDAKDVTALLKKLNQFTNGLGDPGDLNSDGLLSTVDVELLKKLISILEIPSISISPASPTSVCAGLPVSLSATPSSFTATNYSWSSIPVGFSGNGASLTTFTQNAPAVSVSTDYVISVTATNGVSSVSANVTLTVNPCPVGVTQLQLIAPTYNCSTGAFKFNTNGGDGSPITFFAIGITGVTTDPNQFVDTELRMAADAPPITLQATQNGVTVSYVWSIRSVCPVTPGGNLTLVAPTYNCSTGAFKFNTNGGDGSPIEYRAVPGITDWTTNPSQFVDEGSRTANDVQPFLLQARQSGFVTTLTWDLKVACGRARLATSELLTGMHVTIMGSPVSGETVDVEVSGAEQQSLQFRLSNLQGQLVSEKYVEQSAAIERVKLQLSKSAGIYLLQVSSPNQTKVVRVLKAN